MADGLGRWGRGETLPQNDPPERLDQGDLDAALARVDLYADSVTEGPMLVCACGEMIYPESGSSLLTVMDLVAEHQRVCPQVLTDLQKAATESIQRSGYKTKGDFLRSLGGDIKAMQDPLVKEMLRQLPEEPRG